MLNVYVGPQLAGRLFRPESDADRYQFGYDAQCQPPCAVSLSMPVVPEQYASATKVLHPVFDMNLPEGALAERLRKEFSKVIPHFDALALLQVVGQSQIGRLRFARPGEAAPEVPTENLTDLLAHDGAEGLFDSLLARYAVHSGISGAMPKVLVRDSAALSRLSHRGATHIVKAWTDDYPRLAENEYFCIRAALHAGLAVPTCALSSGGQFLLVERFDLRDGVYLGFEDFCVLNGKTASQKYDGSYEGVTRRIRDFVSPEQVRPALAQFFKALARCEGAAGLCPHPLQHDRGAGQGAAGGGGAGCVACGAGAAAAPARHPRLSDGRGSHAGGMECGFEALQSAIGAYRLAQVATHFIAACAVSMRARGQKASQN